MLQACNTWVESEDVNAQLSKLKLKQSTLQTAAQRSFLAWASCTANDPRNFPGIAGWAGCIRGMADELAPEGWRIVTESGQPLIVNADETIALTYATGDNNTGKNGDTQPRTASGKGRKTEEGVLTNAFLFAEMEHDARAKISNAAKRALWVLLMYRDIVEGKIRCELSRPVTMESKKGKRPIIGWSERIILEQIDFGETPRATTNEESGPHAGEITVEIRRRG